MNIKNLFKKKKKLPIPDEPFMQSDYKIGGGWGFHVQWGIGDTDFSPKNMEKGTNPVYGHYTPRPEVGQTLLGEFEKSWCKFQFVEVEYCDDPNDMFFGKVRFIGQEMK